MRRTKEFPPEQRTVHDTHNGESVCKQWNSCELFTVYRCQYTFSRFAFFFSPSLVPLLLYNSYYVIGNHKQLLSTFLYFHFYDPGMSYTHTLALSPSFSCREIELLSFIHSFILLRLVPSGFVCRTSTPFTVRSVHCVRCFAGKHSLRNLIRSNAPKMCCVCVGVCLCLPSIFYGLDFTRSTSKSTHFYAKVSGYKYRITAKHTIEHTK